MTPCNSFITSIFDKERFIYFLRYGIVYLDGKITEKHIMRYPQFFATRKIIEKLKLGGKRGIIWYTQGSGKTVLASFANRLLEIIMLTVKFLQDFSLLLIDLIY